MPYDSQNNFVVKNALKFHDPETESLITLQHGVTEGFLCLGALGDLELRAGAVPFDVECRIEFRTGFAAVEDPPVKSISPEVTWISDLGLLHTCGDIEIRGEPQAPFDSNELTSASNLLFSASASPFQTGGSLTIDGAEKLVFLANRLSLPVYQRPGIYFRVNDRLLGSITEGWTVLTSSLLTTGYGMAKGGLSTRVVGDESQLGPPQAGALVLVDRVVQPALYWGDGDQWHGVVLQP